MNALALYSSDYCRSSGVPAARATDPYVKVAVGANEKLVKLFGAGGYRGAESFGTGIIVSPQGHILTAAAPFLDGRELRLHLPDGRKYAFKVKRIEPAFDAAILEIVQPERRRMSCRSTCLTSTSSRPPRT